MTIDVNDVILDADFADLFVVLRRLDHVTSKGRSDPSTRRYPNTPGVICAASKNDLDRLDDNQRMGRNLSVVTTFPLRGPAPGYQPDEIVWQGDTYVVKALDPYPQYGRGFVQAIVGSIDSVDHAVPALGALNFREPSNAALVGAI